MALRKLVKYLVPRSVFQKIEPAGHLMEAVLLNVIHGFPARGIKVIGVTGTNGKTTTSFLIHRMLHEAGYKVGLMTTVAYGVGTDIRPQIEHLTTPSVSVLLRRFKAMRAAGVEWVVLETSSHALAQYRVWGVPYSVAVLTNISHEHLDYHGTLERYIAAKRQLFELANRNKNGLRTGVINADDAHAEVFASAIKNKIFYGNNGAITAHDAVISPNGVAYTAAHGDKKYRITCHLPGEFNIYNSLAAIGVGEAIGLSVEQIEQGIAALKEVEGRMMRIDEGQNFSVIIDYAHTPDSFEKLFKDLKPITKGKLIVMFGSGGRRDEEKRATQGALAGKYADEVILTEEDDRDMDGQEILEQIARAVEKQGKIRNKDLFLIHDRAAAIECAISQAKKDDMVLLLGKGHEKDILRNGPRAAELRHLQQDDTNPDRVISVPWNEAEVAKKALRQKAK